MRLETYKGQSVIIVPQISNANTYYMLVGGTKRIEKELSGVAIPIDFAHDFDSCRFGGCWELQNKDNADNRQRIAELFDKYSKQHCPKGLFISFDYSRIDLFEEAFIPIVVSGTIGNDIYSKVKCILFTNNNCS